MVRIEPGEYKFEIKVSIPDGNIADPKIYCNNIPLKLAEDEVSGICGNTDIERAMHLWELISSDCYTLEDALEIAARYACSSEDMSCSCYSRLDLYLTSLLDRHAIPSDFPTLISLYGALHEGLNEHTVRLLRGN